MKFREKDAFYENKIYWKDDNNLIKLVENSSEYWTRLMNKNVDFIVKPTEVYELSRLKKIQYSKDCAVVIPYLSNYSTLSKNYCFSYKEGLMIIRDVLSKVKELHNNNIVHGDAHAGNIMIDANKDIKLIDFEFGIVDELISKENLYDYYYADKDEIIRDLKQCDIISVMIILIRFMLYGNFDCVSHVFLNSHDLYNEIENSNIPENIKSWLKCYYVQQEEIPVGYYCFDILDEMIENCESMEPMLIRKQ